MHTILLILVMSVVTFSLRGVPFLIFSGKKEIPPVIEYLSNVLPGAVLGMLVIYCLKDMGSHGFAELIGAGIVVLVQIYKRNTILSIVAGTLCYMMLI